MTIKAAARTVAWGANSKGKNSQAKKPKDKRDKVKNQVSVALCHCGVVNKQNDVVDFVHLCSL